MLGYMIGVGGGCVTDDPVTTQKPTSSSGGSSSGGSSSGVPEAGTCSVPTENGVNCFGSRCRAIFDACCVALGGANTLTGSCVPRADVSEACASAPSALPWECDRAKDCTSGAARCCISSTIVLASRDQCPAVVILNTDAGPPPDRRASRCTTQPNCGAGFTACESDRECVAAETCVPISIQGKVMGACFPRL
jgi:hypothetical protein